MLSFNISKKQDKQRVSSKQAFEGNSSSSEDDEKDYVKSIEGAEIKGTKSKPKKVELVIPLIARNNWTPRSLPVASDNIDNTEDNLNKQAVREILGNLKNDTEEPYVPILFRNRVPEGYENDDNLDVSLRPDQPSVADYERIPIEEFGLAMLRGMGWKKGEGIGLTNKKVVEIVEPRLRPKGLGLGAERPQIQDIQPSSQKAIDNVNLTLKKGAYVLVNRGTNKGLYGKIEAFDEDNNRLIVQMAIGNKMIGISKYAISLVSETEFKNKSKILNNDLYDEYKQKHDEAAAKRQAQKTQNTEPMNVRRVKDSHHKNLSSSSKSNPIESSSKKIDEDSKERNNIKEIWVVPNLKVRMIDSKFRDGKYYRQKLTVVDEMERDSFVLKSHNGDILERISSSQLETVIPKTESAFVYILSGRQKGKIGKLIEKDNRDEIGVVQIPDEGVLELHYDDICHFVGDVEDLF